MEQMDDFFNNKLNRGDDNRHPRIEFQEEYWLQAQALLEADEKRKKRFGFMWWVLAGLLLVCAGLFAWHSLAWSPVAKETGINMPEAQTPLPVAVPENTIRKAVKDPSLPPVSVDSQAKSTAIHTENTPQTDTKTATKEPIKRTSGSKSSVNHSVENRYPNTTNKSGSSLEKQSAYPIKSDQNGQVENSALPTSGQNAMPLTSKTSTTATLTTSENKITSGAPETARWVENLEPLLREIMPLALPLLPWTPPTESPFLPKNNKKPSETAFAFGVMGSGTFNMGSGKRFTGGTAGIFATYRLSKKLDLMAELRLRHRMGTESDAFVPPTTKQSSYGFGSVLVQNSLAYNSVQSVELPLGIRYRLGKNALELGIAPSYVFNAQATWTQAQSSTLGEKTETQKSIHTKPSLFRSVLLPVFLGYDRALSDKISLGLRASWASSAMYESPIWKENGNFWLDIHVKYRILRFKK